MTAKHVYWVLGSFLAGFFVACLMIKTYSYKGSVPEGECQVSCSIQMSDGMKVTVNHQGAKALHQTASAFKSMSEAADVGAAAYKAVKK